MKPLLICTFVAMLIAGKWLRDYLSRPYWMTKSIGELARDDDQEGIRKKIEYGRRHSVRSSLKAGV